MPNLGLLGAISGFGQALQTAGQDIVKRREQALEAARKEAEYQRNRTDKMADREDTQAFEVSQLNTKEDAADARTRATLSARATERDEDREFRKSERKAGESFKSSESNKDRSARRDLAKLTASLSKANTAAETRLRDQLQADDVHAVQYGAPDANGYAEVFVVTKTGSVRPTGQRVYRPKKDDEEDSSKL